MCGISSRSERSARFARSRNQLTAAWRSGVLLALACTFAACGGGDGGSTAPPPTGASTLALVSGDGQRARITRALPLPIVVVARSSSGASVSGATVTFTPSSGSIDPASATTDASGQASARWTVGTTAGAQTLSVRLSNGAGSPLTISATVDPALSVTIVALDGDRQQALMATAVPVVPRVQVRDALGAPLSGIGVRFAVTVGGGSVSNALVVTDATGVATAGAWTLGSAAGNNAISVTPSDGDVVATLPLSFTAVGVAPGGVTSSPMRSYVLSSSGVTTVRDSVTGQLFRFPDGAHGTLDVARVLGGPATPIDGAVMFRALYSGVEAVEIATVRPAAGAALAFSFGDDLSAQTQGTVVARWWGMPASRVVGDSVFFPLQTDASALISSSTSGAPRLLSRAGRGTASLASYSFASVTASASASTPAVGAYAIVALPASSPWTSRFTLYVDGVQQTIDWWLAQLPAADAARTRANIAAHVPLKVTYGLSGVSGYEYIRRWLTWYPTLYFADRQPDLLQKLVRHETGHYLSHMMLGDAAYKTLTNNGPVDTLHFPGEIARGLRQSLSEEYAYVSEFFTMGNLNGLDLRSLSYNQNAETLMKDQKPFDVDFPSLEGFGTIMMAAVTRSGSDTLVYDFWSPGSRTRSPALGVSVGAVLGVLAQGPQNPNQLRVGLATVAGSAEALAAVLEPVGGSYSGAGRVVDGAGQPVAGATVRSIVKVGSTEYRTFESVLTGSDGRFTLRRIYPGVSTLRVYKQNATRLDSTDAKQLTIPWETATNAPQTLGDLVLVGLPAYNAIAISVGGFSSVNTLGSRTCPTSFDFLNSVGTQDVAPYPDLTWNGNRFSASGTYSYTVVTSDDGKHSAHRTSTIAISGTIDVMRADSIWISFSGSQSYRADDIASSPTGPVTTLEILTSSSFNIGSLGMRTNGATPATYLATVHGAAAAVLINNATMSFYNVSALIPTFNPYSCTAYSLNPLNADVQVTLRIR